MREILFRGKHVKKGGWVEGFYVERDNQSWIYPTNNQIISKSLARELRPFHSTKSTQRIMQEVFPVDPATVGQYTGLKDKNGKRIFEGDIVTIPGSKMMGLPAHVAYFPKGAVFQIKRNGYNAITLWNAEETVEVIGNIHDNPELLGGGEDG